MELGFFGRSQSGRRKAGVVARSAGRAGPVVVLRLSKLDFVYAESVFFFSRWEGSAKSLQTAYHIASVHPRLGRTFSKLVLVFVSTK